MNPLRNALLSGRKRPRHAGTGSPTLFRGDGYEFVELREYVAGDDPRRIDWAATARTGALQTRVVLEDVALTLAAIVDNSGSMRAGRRRALLDCAEETLRLWYGAALADDRCVRLSHEGLVVPLTLRGPRSAAACAAAALPQMSPGDLRRALDMALAALPRGSALLVASDFFDLDTKDDRMLGELGVRFDCTALVARDPWHAGLPLGGFVRVADVETGRSHLLFLGARERERYVRAVHERERALAFRLTSLGWRVGQFEEGDGTRGLLGAFGLI